MSFFVSQTLLEDEKYYQEEDDRWKQKLEEEAQFEYEEQQPRYSTKDDGMSFASLSHL